MDFPVSYRYLPSPSLRPVSIGSYITPYALIFSGSSSTSVIGLSSAIFVPRFIKSSALFSIEMKSVIFVLLVYVTALKPSCFFDLFNASPPEYCGLPKGNIVIPHEPLVAAGGKLLFILYPRPITHCIYLLQLWQVHFPIPLCSACLCMRIWLLTLLKALLLKQCEFQ